MLVVPTGIRDELVSHAREGAPEEVCGVLGGVRASSSEAAERAAATDDLGSAGDGDPDDRTTVAEARRVPNVAENPRTEYLLDPESQLSAIETLEAAGDDVVGFYHSHPRGPARPSATDRARATWPGASYVVVSLVGEPRIGSWRWDGEVFRREYVRITN